MQPRFASLPVSIIAGTPGPEQRIYPAARIMAVWRTYPAAGLAVAVLAMAAAAASGYLTRASMSQPAATNSMPGSQAGEPKSRDTLIWRDEAGDIYRAKIGGGRFDEFLRRRKETLEAARTQSRDQASAEVMAALKPVFADMTARVPGYADWYFGYLTKYQLMSHALLPGLDYLGGTLGFGSPPDKSLVQTIGPHVVKYLEEQYAERVVWPHATELRLRDAFDKSYDALQAHWKRIIDEQRGAMHAFVKEQAGSAERLSADQAAGIELDWDGREHGSTMHAEGTAEKSFRRGLLSVRLKIPKSAKAPDRPDVGGKTPEETDEITHVIVNLFDKLIGPVVSQMSDLAIGVFAGSAAGGTTAGFGMAGGLGMAGPPAAFATGVATAVPVGAAIGLAATVVAEMLSNRLEESLNREEFEEGLRQTVAATENAIETGMIAVLHEHVEGWYADIVNPVAIGTGGK
jgi:hypothetical protein